MKQDLAHLHKAIELSASSGKPVPIECDVNQAMLDALALTLGYSVTFVERPEGGRRIDGKGPDGQFTLLLEE